MIKKTKLAGAVLAITMASVFALTPVMAMGKHKIDCSGAKGTKGIVKMSKRMCEKKGGTVAEENSSSQPK